MGRPLACALLLAASGCSNDIQVAGSQNTAPAAAIQTPTSGTGFASGEVVDFVGLVTDSNGLDDIVSVFWNSNIDGELADIDSASLDSDGITRLALLLSAGNHAITLTATDADGAVGEDSINLSVGDAQQDPLVTVDAPTNFFETYPGGVVDLLGSVFDGQQPAQTLLVDWTIERNSDNAPIDAFAADLTASGIASGTWIATDQGNYLVRLTAEDEDGNIGFGEVLVVVVDPDFADLDGDSFAPATGDCDDADPNVNPNADETCADLTDNDCNGIVDDKDLDNDGHIDDACVTYTGLDPVDDCDDDDPVTHGGAAELPDGVDNDCDGGIDNGGAGFDDDGDCFCEQAPCFDSVDALCLPILAEGDCDDADPNVNPGVLDDPDQMYVDDNCDGLDGDALGSVFLDPIAGNNGNSGLDTGATVRTLDVALDIAQTTGRNWILIAEGTVDFTNLAFDFVQGVHLAGGYDSGAAWDRFSGVQPTIQVEPSGKGISNWTIPTEWQQIGIEAQSTVLAGASSIALRIENSSGLTILASTISAGDAGPGLSGTAGLLGTTGSAGLVGEAGGNSDDCAEEFFGICILPCFDPEIPRPVGGAGGSGCALGGAGGSGSNHNQAGLSGATGAGVGGGTGGAGGPDANPGTSGLPGSAGVEGANGTPGQGIGTYIATGFTPSNGASGGSGAAGAGGGGGGGGGGGIDGLCESYGASGGGGGGGGCGGGTGTGGTGGGASTAVVLVASNISIIDSYIETGAGGPGGAGGSGGTGGVGGIGGQGGLGDNCLVCGDDSGNGGDGQNGGAGGRGGHGGGGGGGPSIGVVCRSGSALTATSVLYTLGSGGPGGGGLGSPGSTGQQINADGC